MFSVVSVLVCFVLALAHAQQGGSHRLHESRIRWIDCRDQVPFTLDLEGIDTENLPDALHCGELVVPMDHAKPICAENNITLGLAMYRPEKPKGVVFFNPGGTDEATIFAWQAALNQSQEFSELLDYDLMMMDVRGTYHSNPLNVSLEKFEPIIGPYPTTPAEFSAFRKASAAVFDSFADLSTPSGILKHLGTNQVVQDLESIRIALGYKKINFLGASYGSYRAEQYAATYPKRVGNFVMDAVVPHGVSLSDQAQHQIAAANRGLLRADAYCQNNSTCPFNSNGKGGVLKAFQKVLATAERLPIVAASCVNSTACKSPVTATLIQMGMVNSLMGNPDFPVILGALDLALQGDASYFAIAAGDPIPNVQVVWAVPLLCNDYDLGKNNFESFEKSLKAGLKHDTNHLGRCQAWQIMVLCSGWKYATPANEKLPIHAPLMLVTADFDASAPTEWARVTHKQHQNSVLVIRHGDDHVSYQLPNQPSSLITTEFIRTGKFPTARDEKLVSVYTPGKRVGPIADPYNVPTGVIVGDVDSS